MSDILLFEKYITPHMWNMLVDHFPDQSEDELRKQTEEFLKFMIIVSEQGGSFIPLNKELDEIWHEFILQTDSYNRLCDSLPGRRFIHHESMSLEKYADRHGRDHVVSEMMSWLPDYISRFGEFKADIADYWTMCLFLKNEMGMTLAEINTVGKEKNRQLAEGVGM